MRIVGLAYVVYFALSIAGSVARNVPLQVASTAFYFVLSVLLYRLFAVAEARIALALLPLAAIGCVVQAVGQIQGDAALLRYALVPFAAFLLVLGYLITRSSIVPTAIGVLLIAAGLAWPVTVIPGVPVWYVGIALLIGIAAEGSLAIWLLVRG